MKKIILIVVIIAAGYYLYQSPWFSRFIPSESRHAIKQTIDSVNPKMSKILYKWKDSKGQWHMTDTPPADGTAYETVRYHKDTNVIPAEQFKSGK